MLISIVMALVVSAAGPQVAPADRSFLEPVDFSGGESLPPLSWVEIVNGETVGSVDPKALRPSSEITCSSTTYWCPDVTVPAEPSRVVVPVFEKAARRLRIAASGEQVPPAVWVETWSTVAESTFERAVRLTVDEEGWIEISWPKGARSDVRIAAEGLTPAYLFDVGTSDVHQIQLTPGSSIIGFVYSVFDEKPIEGATVALAPRRVLSEDNEARVSRANPSTQTNDRGFFQLGGVPPGEVQIEVSAAGQSTVFLSEVVQPASELQVSAVWMSPLSDISFSIYPAGTYKVTLTTADGADVFESRTDSMSIAAFEALELGEYRVAVHSEDGKSRFWYEMVDLDAPGLRTIDLPLIRLYGAVLAGDEPIPSASIRIETGSADATKTKADEEGLYSTLIRRPVHDVLFVKVEAEEVSRRMAFRDLGLAGDEREYELRIELGGASLEGRVLTQDGAGAPGSKVWLAGDDDLGVEVETDSRGDFVINYLPEGRVELQARHTEHGESPAEVVDLLNDRGATALTLRLVRKRLVTGVVLDANQQPVVGADVWVSPVNGSHSSPQPTGLDGRFEIRVRPSKLVWVQVFATGFEPFGACQAIEEPLVLQLSPMLHTVNLALRVAENQEATNEVVTSALLYRVGGKLQTLNQRQMSRWVRARGGAFNFEELVLPNMPPGQYAALYLSPRFDRLASIACGLEPVPPGVRWSNATGLHAEVAFQAFD